MSLLATLAVGVFTVHCTGTEKSGLFWEERPATFELSVNEDEVIGVGGPFEGASLIEARSTGEAEILILASFDDLPSAQLQLTFHDDQSVDWMLVEVRGKNGELTIEAQGSARCENSDITRFTA